jgi:hypothetical protein
VLGALGRRCIGRGSLRFNSKFMFSAVTKPQASARQASDVRKARRRSVLHSRNASSSEKMRALSKAMCR